jgi:hypothetical protein
MGALSSPRRELCLSYVGAFRHPQRRPCHGMNAPSPAQHALALARASFLPPAPSVQAQVGGGWWMVDGLFVCNSHIGVHGKEAMTRTGRRDAMLMRDEAALHLAACCLHGGGTLRRRSRPIAPLPAMASCSTRQSPSPIIAVQTHQKASVVVPTPVPAASSQQPAASAPCILWQRF